MSVQWLLGTFGVVLVLAAICSYGSVGLLFYQGQWQFMLHPVKTITATRQAKYEDIRFDYTEAGLPRLRGWWIPADAGARWSGDTVPFLHGGKGSLSDSVGELDALHALGVNVFAFDYRGYGVSAGSHPDEKRMREDANAAWSYLTDTRQEAAKTIVIYGNGVGASLAAELAAQHAAAGVVLEGPSETARKVIEADGRARILPLWLLLTEKFDPAKALKKLAVPKLFVDRDGAKARTEKLYREAASPKQYVELKQGEGYAAAMEQFLGGVLGK